VKTDPGAKVEIRAGDQDLGGETGDVRGGGRRYTVQIPPRAASLTVSIFSPDGSRGPSWSLLLKDKEEPAWIAEINKLESSGNANKIAARLKQLRRTRPQNEQGEILRALAEQARREGNNRETEIYLKQGIAADHAEACISGEVKKTGNLARLYLEQGRFSAARSTLESLRLPPGVPEESKFQKAFYLGLLSNRVGDFGSALKQLRKAALLAERVNSRQHRWPAEHALANLYQDLGRWRDASEIFARLRAEAEHGTPCDEGDLLTSWAWLRLLMREAGEAAEDPAPMLGEAQDIYDKNPSCATPKQRLDARLNLTFAHLQAKRWIEARHALEQVRPMDKWATLRQHLWWRDFEAQIAIAEKDPARALHLYQDLEKIAGRALSFEGRFRAAFGRAHAQLALGDRAAALTALAEADHLIDEQTWSIPAHEGRDTLVALREAATRLYLNLLLKQEKLATAFDLARRSRSRLLRQLTVRDRLAQLGDEERGRVEQALASYQSLRNTIDQEAAEEWQLSGSRKKFARETRAAQLDEAREGLDLTIAALGVPGKDTQGRLAPPRPGEVILAYHPLPEGWVGFAADERGIEFSRFKMPPQDLKEEALAQILLEPFRPSLERAGRVRVLAYGRLRSVDFHSLPFGAEPLLARHLVVYGLDLPARPAPIPPNRRVALLVMDPAGNLPAARQEATSVADAVKAWGPSWTLERLNVRDAQAKTVRTKLPGVFLFHYAGHGKYGGFAGWESGLELSDGSRLTVADALALPQAPTWVVLSSCEGGRSSEQAPGEGIGLAQAFLLAGSQVVVAATRTVDDSIARDLWIELYHGWQSGGDLPRQFQRAQWVCYQSHPDCASFRLLEP
jgi:tetratricopeptide (TPR) repeat protein